MSAKAKARTDATPPPRAWQRMLSGRRLDLLDPSPLDVEIEDIAHGLARLARWNGQTIGGHALSVAQHCLIVEEIVVALRPSLSAQWRIAALLHDAAEYVVGDVISPFKAALGDEFKSVENRLDRAIRLRFGLPPELPVSVRDLIKRADKIAAHIEAVALAGFTTSEANRLFIAPPDGMVIDTEPLPANEAQTQFKARFDELITQSGTAP